MKKAYATLVGSSAYSQSKHFSKEQVPMLEKELHDAYERRTWRNRLHVDKDDEVFIPPMAFANCIKTSAKRLGTKIPGRGQRTYTKSFESGVMVLDRLPLGIKKDDVPYDEPFVPSDGVPGSGKRVTKLFPRIDEWEGEVLFHILDDVIDQKIFKTTLENAGMLVGIGRFRPESRGFYGRFNVKKVRWDG